MDWILLGFLWFQKTGVGTGILTHFICIKIILFFTVKLKTYKLHSSIYYFLLFLQARPFIFTFKLSFKQTIFSIYKKSNCWNRVILDFLILFFNKNIKMHYLSWIYG
jgi:hypothetical protein